MYLLEEGLLHLWNGYIASRLETLSWKQDLETLGPKSRAIRKVLG
jgi:hypothetical protein